MKISKKLPFFHDVAHYNGTLFRGDLLAGLTVAIMLIPQGMAYAMLAGLPPIYGLYAGFVPLLIYPFFGTSRQLSVGPVALVSIIILSGLSVIAEPGSPEFIQLALLTTALAGLLQVLMAIFRMGFLVNFLSEPVIAGFTAAAAIIIGISQLKYVFGISLGSSSSIVGLVKSVFLNLGNTHWLSLVLGTSSIAFILILNKIRPKWPGALLVILISTSLVYFLSWEKTGIAILAKVPGGLPSFDAGFIDMAQISDLFPLALAICLISFIESLAIAKTIAARHGNYPINANNELFGLGMAKIISSFFQGSPTSGSFTRSAINDQAGSRSGMSSVFAAFFVGITLLFLTNLLYYIPKPVLAAIVISAVFGLINIGYAKNLSRLDRKDFYVYLATFCLTLLLGVQQGVFAGIALSVLMILYKSSKPHYAILGKLKGTNTFRNIDRFKNTHTIDKVLIIRYDDDIYFGNSDHFYDSIMLEVDQRENIETIILNGSVISRIDSTGLKKLKLLLETLEKRRIKILFTSLRGPVRDLLAKSGLSNKIGNECCFLNIQDALDAIDLGLKTDELSIKYAAQKNT